MLICRTWKVLMVLDKPTDRLPGLHIAVRTSPQSKLSSTLIGFTDCHGSMISHWKLPGSHTHTCQQQKWSPIAASGPHSQEPPGLSALFQPKKIGFQYLISRYFRPIIALGRSHTKAPKFKIVVRKTDSALVGKVRKVRSSTNNTHDNCGVILQRVSGQFHRRDADSINGYTSY